jgi:hypothetical protein
MTAYRRTLGDVEKAMKTLSSYFKEDFFVLIGSQAGLISYPSAPDAMRNTPEVDVYMASVTAWERENPGREADFEIAGNFGQGSYFHQSFGFYIDGVSPNTAALPEDWRRRAVYHEFKYEERQITVVSPVLEDLVVSKMRRLAEKDREFIVACYETRGLDKDMVLAGLMTAPFLEEERERAATWFKSIEGKQFRAARHVDVPDYPANGTHCAFWNKSGYQVTIREYDQRSGLFYKVSNPLGPAIKTVSAEAYYLGGRRTTGDKIALLRSEYSSVPDPSRGRGL